MSEARKYRPATRMTALAILTDISDTPMTWEEICKQYDMSRRTWQQTYRPAVRQLAEEVGMYVPRPVPTDGFRYAATDVWNGTPDDPRISAGFRVRLRDEVQRLNTSIDHVLAAQRGAITHGDPLLAAALDDVRKLEEAAVVHLKSIAERIGA